MIAIGNVGYLLLQYDVNDAKSYLSIGANDLSYKFLVEKAARDIVHSSTIFSMKK